MQENNSFLDCKIENINLEALTLFLFLNILLFSKKTWSEWY